MNRYIDRHLNKSKYFADPKSDGIGYRSVYGWTDFMLSRNLIYSHRKTDYSRAEFDETAHIHDYYELVIYMGGNVDFVTESKILSPAPMSAVFFRPGEIHNTRLNEPSVYERCVFYFYSELFLHEGKYLPFCDFLTEPTGNFFEINTDIQKEISAAIVLLDCELKKNAPNPLLCTLRAMEIFDILSRSEKNCCDSGKDLPAKMLEIKDYIDKNYAEISSVTEISEHFFYTREYVSRLFKRYYNVSVSDYLARQRITHAIDLIKNGSSVTNAAIDTGFGSPSSFYLTFKRIVGMSPSDFAKRER